MGRGFSSNSDMFRKRGDPWVSRREGEKDFGRNLETEDAEYDFDHRFHSTGGTFGKPKIAQPKEEYRDPTGKPTDADFARRKANILARMNKRINELSPTKPVAEAVHRFRPCGGCRKAACIAKGLCLRPDR